MQQVFIFQDREFYQTRSILVYRAYQSQKEWVSKKRVPSKRVKSLTDNNIRRGLRDKNGKKVKSVMFLK